MQKAFKQFEKKKDKERQFKLKFNLCNYKGIPMKGYSVNPEEIAMCVLKVIYDTMNGRKLTSID